MQWFPFADRVKTFLNNGIVEGVQVILGLLSFSAIFSARILGVGDQTLLTMVASTSFVLIALVGGGLSGRYGAALFAGVLGCFLGDMLGMMDFLWGLYAFLAAHLFYIIAFSFRGICVKALGWGVLIFGSTTLAVMLIIFPDIEHQDRWPMIAYALVIAASMIWATGTWGHEKKRGGTLLFAGAILFYVSDVLLAGWHVWGSAFAPGPYCYLLYYPGVALLASSIRPWVASR